MEGYLEQWMDSLDMSGFYNGLEHFFPGLSLDGEGLLSMIMEGNIGGAIRLLTEQIKDGLWAQISGMREIFLCILILGIVSALFAEFSDLFAGQQMAQMSFYFLYLFLISVLTKVFLYVSEIAATAIDEVLLFIKMFIPTYFVAVGAAQGTYTAAYYYYLTLLAAYFVENILHGILLPFIYCYVLLALLNGLWPEEKLTLLLDFMQKGVGVALKILVGGITSLSLVQGLILPAADGLKLSAMRKAISSLPGIGNMAGGVTELFVGSAVLIKNSIGVMLFLLLVTVGALPLLKMVLVSGIVKLAAAVTGIVSDKRISGAANRVGEGCMMLFKCVCVSMVMFLIVIAVVAYTFSG